MAAPIRELEYSKRFLRNRRLSADKVAKFDEITEISGHQFFIEYLIPNKPCIFNQSVTESWRSRQDWVQKDGTPNFNFLRQNFGEAIVPVANCKQEQYSSHPKQDWTLGQYLDYWEDFRANDYAGNKPCLYLKDLHFTKAFPSYQAYQTPVYFQSDWLNEFWDTRPLDDYRFVYMGPKGTWTPFHSDVYRSYSWSANICGKKKWIFYPPGCEECLKDKFGNLIYDVTALDNTQKYPNSDKVKNKRLEVIQGQGQIIFVPSGWHHQVYNMEDTISINHNWLNGCNIDICWEHLCDNLHSVKHEIADLNDMEGWEEQCQFILNASAGINYQTFIEMLKVIATNRLEKLKSLDTENHCGRERICQTSLQETQGNIDVQSPNGSGIFKGKTNSEQNSLAGFDDKLIGSTRSPPNQSCSQTCENILKVVRNFDQGNTFDSHKTLMEETNTADTNNTFKENGIVNEHASKDKETLTWCHFKTQYANFSNDDSPIYKQTNSSKGSINRENKVVAIDTSVDCVHNKVDITEQKWCILFDLCRIRETLIDIIKDKDYMSLQFDKERSAEYVLDLIGRSGQDCIT